MRSAMLAAALVLSTAMAATSSARVVTFDSVDPVTGDHRCGFRVTSIEDDRVSLLVADFGGDLQIQLEDSGFRLWWPDDITDEERGKLVLFRSDAMAEPRKVRMSLAAGETDRLFTLRVCRGAFWNRLTASDVLDFAQCGTLYVRVCEPSETFTFDMSDGAISTQLELMNIAGRREVERAASAAQASPEQSLRQAASAAVSAWAWSGNGYPTMRVVDARAAAEARKVGYIGEDFKKFREAFREAAVRKFTGM